METGFFYLQSRYYDPETGRFINADSVSYLGADGTSLSYNLYAYCLNNPANRADENGTLSLPNWMKIVVGTVATVAAITLTVATGGGAAAVAVGVAKVIGGVALQTAIGAGVGYLQNGKQGAIDGACTGFMTGGLSAFGGAALKYISSPANGIDTYRNLRKVNKGTKNQVHHIIEKRFADTLGIANTDDMLSIALSEPAHKVYTKAWRAILPYGNTYSKTQILGAAIKVYAKTPSLLITAVKTLLD